MLLELKSLRKGIISFRFRLKKILDGGRTIISGQ